MYFLTNKAFKHTIFSLFLEKIYFKKFDDLLFCFNFEQKY
jgi:hypothetical protein